MTTLYSFCPQDECADGQGPYAGLIQTADGNLYGTTYYGGSHNYGTVFQLAPGGALTTLHRFCLSACADGKYPYAGLVQATNGELYGTTSEGGANLSGTIFKITPTGTFTTLYSFCSQPGCPDGSSPYGGLMQSTDGDLYGTTFYGGANKYGTIFRLSVGLGPFVATRPTAGPVGAAVIILGTDLTGTTSVSFNGAAAAFEIVSNSEITTTVPAGATSGKVQVVIPSGTLSSNMPFRVQP